MHTTRSTMLLLRERSTEPNSTKKYRAKLNKANKAKPNKKGEDKSHTKSGKLVNEKRASNRARNGRGGKAKKK
jgi:hypothetical protein